MNGVITQLWKRKETWHIVTLINPEHAQIFWFHPHEVPELSHSETQGRRVATTAREDGMGSWCLVNTACFSEERAADLDAGDGFTGL